MRYEVHITRRKYWSNIGNDISVEEWRVVVEADPELEPQPDKGPNVVRWRGSSALEEPFLEWYFGNIVASDPDRPLIDKMVALAPKLGGRVQGDRGEIYTPDGIERCLEPLTPGARIASWFGFKKK